MAMFQPAVKEKLKARVAIDGPTGSGKTWTALQLARILAGPDGDVGLIDTENRSAAYYAPSAEQLSGAAPMERLNYYDAPYLFGHAPVSPPYSPVQLAELIKAAAAELGEDGVLVIDSLTHFWSGEGGTLDVVDAAASRSGNSFAGWKEGTPAQRHMLDTIIHAPCHVVVTMRSKMEYILEETTGRNGQKIQVPKKVGMAPEQRAGIEYEFTVVGDMDLEHRLVISKSRCSLIADVVAPIGRSAEVFERFASWLDSGVERITEDQAKALVDTMNSVTDVEARTGLKKGFVDTFGKPTEITTDRVPEVLAWVTERVNRLNGVEVPRGTTGVEQDGGDAAADLLSSNGTSDGTIDDDVPPNLDGDGEPIQPARTPQRASRGRSRAAAQDGATASADAITEAVAENLDSLAGDEPDQADIAALFDGGDS